jgi:hypothetical protein
VIEQEATLPIMKTSETSMEEKRVKAKFTKRQAA